jgi:nitroimidazol reductase NimA-like FMN-containing flavoprotein (pyridoxamine 5'-phosphate oxidase superfamily)
MLGKLDTDQMNSLLSSSALGRLACTDGNQPYIVPVTYTYDGNYIYGQTNEGTKLDILRKNPNVCFQVEQMTDMRNWQSVIVYGKFEELKNKKDADSARDTLFSRFFPLMSSSTIHSFGKEATNEIEDPNRIKYVMYRINIQKITGRFEKQ